MLERRAKGAEKSENEVAEAASTKKIFFLNLVDTGLYSSYTTAIIANDFNLH